MSNDLSILIVRLSAIGDVVMTTAAVRALRRHMPGSRISWVIEPKSAGILADNPDIDEIIVTDKIGPKSILKLARELRKQKFDVALDFQGLARSAVVTAASGAKRRIGYADGRELSGFVYSETVACPVTEPRRRCRHGMDCYMRLLKPIGITPDDKDGDMRVTVSEDDRKAAVEIAKSAGVGIDEPAVALCPATTRANKHWTEDGWSRLADMIWREENLKGIFLGSQADREMIDRILAKTRSPAVNLAGRTTLKQAVAVLDRCETVVSVDTGLLHIGVAIGRPTVGIFGPTTAWRNHIHQDNFTVVRKEMACVPCYKKPTCERFECISDVKPEDVLSALQKVTSSCGLEENETCKAE